MRAEGRPGRSLVGSDGLLIRRVSSNPVRRTSPDHNGLNEVRLYWAKIVKSSLAVGSGLSPTSNRPSDSTRNMRLMTTTSIFKGCLARTISPAWCVALGSVPRIHDGRGVSVGHTVPSDTEHPSGRHQGYLGKHGSSTSRPLAQNVVNGFACISIPVVMRNLDLAGEQSCAACQKVS